MTESDKATALQGLQRTACEVWSRVTGYLRPVKAWNKGKQAEWIERKSYTIDGNVSADIKK